MDTLPCKKDYPLLCVFNLFSILAGKIVSSRFCSHFKPILNELIFRLGFYNTAYERGWTRNKDGNVSILKSAFFGGVGGTVGQALASPFFMLRNQLQSASVSEIAVGHQHKHEGFIQAFKKVYKAHGVTGLYRGVLVTVPRGMMGSGTQIATFGCTKDLLQRKFPTMDQTLISFISGATAGTAMAIAMNPTDVISTRLYNQGVHSDGKGMYYSGVIDCFSKILKTEGVRGFYKGFWPHYIRIGPHSALVLLFFDELKALKGRLIGN